MMLGFLLLACTFQAVPAQQELISPFLHPRSFAAEPLQGETFASFSDRDPEVAAPGGGRILLQTSTPLVLTRFWTPTPQGKLRFFAPGADQPFYEVEVARLCGADPGGVFRAPFAVGAEESGWTCILPLACPQGLRLVASERALRYRIEARRLPEGITLPRFSDELFAAAESDLSVAARLWSHGELLSMPQRQTSAFGNLRPNLPAIIRFRQDGTVALFRAEILRADEIEDLPNVLRGLRVQVFADGSEEAQIDVPLGDFFGCGSRFRVFQSAFLRTSRVPGKNGKGGKLVFESNLPIPYHTRMTLQVVNESSRTVSLRLYAQMYQDVAPPLRLHAAWHLDRGLTPEQLAHYTLLDADGPGRLIGCFLEGRGAIAQSSFDPTGFFALPADGKGVLASGSGLQGEGASARFAGFRIFAPFGLATSTDLKIEVPLFAKGGESDVATLAWWYAPVEAGHRMGPLPDPDHRLDED